MTIEQRLKDLESINHVSKSEHVDLLIQALRKTIEQRDRMTYNYLTEEERKLFFADKVLNKLDKEILEILEGK